MPLPHPEVRGFLALAGRLHYAQLPHHSHESYPSQPSTSLPSEIRTISMPGSVTWLPVGAMPASSPSWVPAPVQRVAEESARLVCYLHLTPILAMPQA